MAITEADLLGAKVGDRFFDSDGLIWEVLEILHSYPFGLLVFREGCQPEAIYWRDGDIRGQMGDLIEDLNHPKAFVFYVNATERAV
jgi:hypothetical protein